MTRLTFGCDPEVFIRDKKNGKFISAHPFFPGTKDDPHPVEAGAVQVDGLALEFNINPAINEREFVGNVETVLRQLKEMVHKASPDFEIVYSPTADFDPFDFMMLPFDPKVLGCDPDYDDDGNLKTPPEGMQDLPFRTAAGHMHIGWGTGKKADDPVHMDNCKIFAKSFKTVRGYVPNTAEEWRRAKFYGAPGSFRPKSYGVELRSPSNWWLTSRENITNMFRETYRNATRISESHAL